MTLDEARKIVDAGLAKAKGMGVKISIVVVNEEGHIISLARMDGTGFLTPDIAVGKAIAAAAFKRSSAEIQKSAETRTAFFAGISTLAHGRFLAGMGGLPILRGQEVLGAVGVSGAKPEEDQEIAQVGLNAL
ncbi:MAG: GlcG/HbpS family heme-binding protein [Candidatus Binatia bacterium]